MSRNRKRSTGRTAHFHERTSGHALLIQLVDLLVSLFYKKQQTDPSYIRNWEREKILNFSLSSAPLQARYTPAKDIRLSHWDSEKVFNFGLTKNTFSKNSHRYKHVSKEKLADEKLTPKIAPVKWKKQQPQNVIEEKEHPIDDFFKILGYE